MSRINAWAHCAGWGGVAALTGCLLAVGCFELAPLPPCEFNEQCGEGMRCDLDTGICVRRQGNPPPPLPRMDMEPLPVAPTLDWIYIAPGRFVMGADEGVEDAAPAREVSLERAFFVARNEVTVAEYALCVQARVCRAPQTGSLCNWAQAEREDHPINCITWYDARIFAGWVGGRLPTEAEWEYLARGNGADVTYPWGEDPVTCGNAARGGPTGDCGPAGTARVCRRRSGDSAAAICDLAGNVAEWTADAFEPDYTDAPVDGSAREGPDDAPRVIRGGGWSSDEAGLRTRARDAVAPEEWRVTVGLRVVRE